jgi:hypothetical protein
VIWISRLGDGGLVACGACDRVAICVLHNADAISTSSMVRFFCAHHLRNYLENHPEYAEHLMDRMGTQGLYAFYE